MFAGFRGLKVFAVGAAFFILAQSASAENKCRIGLQECADHHIDTSNIQAGDESVGGFCKSFELNHKTCRVERDFALAYTTMAAYCGLVCVMSYIPYTKATALAMQPYCTAGSALVSVSEIVFTKLIASEREAYADKSSKELVSHYGLDTVVGQSANALYLSLLLGAQLGHNMSAIAGIGSTAGKAANSQAASKNGGTCVTAIVNGAFATIKWKNRSNIVANSMENFLAADKLWTTSSNPSVNTASGQNQIMLSGGGGGSPPPIADTRTPATEVSVKDDKVDLAKIGESYATAGTNKLFGDPTPKDFKAAFDGLSKHTGITPDELMNSLEANGVGGTLSKLTGDSEQGKLMGEAFKEMDSKISGMGRGALAFEGTGGGGGSGSGKKDGGMDLSSLFGARGPAADAAGGVKGIQFGGFNNDIWHAGSTLSIFEIVSRKTQTVSSRVEK